MGRFTLTQYAAIAQLQSDQIGQSWRDTHEFRRDKGLTPTGGKRWGYVWDKGKDPAYTPDLTMLDVIHQAYDSYIAGASFATLVRTLRKQNVRTAEGQELTTGNLRAMMDSGFAAGLIVRYKRDPDTGYAIQSLDSNEYTPGVHDPIISLETWDEYVAERRTRNTAERVAQAATRASGLVRCTSCGSLMSLTNAGIRKSDGKRYRYFSCNRRSKVRHSSATACPDPARIPVEEVEAAVLVWLKDLVDKEESPEEVLKRAQAVSRARDDAKGLERELKKLEKQRESLTMYLLDGTVSTETYQATAPKLDQQIAEARVSLTRAKQDAGHVAPALSADAADQLARAWHSLPEDVMRDALSQVVSRIEVRAVKVDPRVRVVPRWAESEETDEPAKAPARRRARKKAD